MKEVGDILTRSTDVLVSHLKRGGGGVCPAVAERLRDVHFREETMVARYTGDTRGRYQYHSDDGGGLWRWLTVILYINRDWHAEDQGHNRLYFPGRNNCRVKADILPVANRLLVFWASDDCPHEVLSTRRDRWALSTWYTHGPIMLRDRAASTQVLNRISSSEAFPPGVLEMLPAFFPVRPLSFRDGVLLSGLAEEQANRMSELYEFLHEQRGKCGKEDFMQLIRYISSNGGKPCLPPVWPLGIADAAGAPRRDVDGKFSCASCRQKCVDGSVGVGEFKDQWFCGRCWRSW